MYLLLRTHNLECKNDDPIYDDRTSNDTTTQEILHIGKEGSVAELHSNYFRLIGDTDSSGP